MHGSAGAIVNHVTTSIRDQGRLLDETNRDLETFKDAYYGLVNDLHDQEARFRQEIQALSDEVHQSKVRTFPHIQREVIGARFELPHRKLISSVTMG